MRLQFSIATLLIATTLVAIVLALWPRSAPPKKQVFPQQITFLKLRMPSGTSVLEFKVHYRDGSAATYVDLFSPTIGGSPGIVNSVSYLGSPARGYVPNGSFASPEGAEDPRGFFDRTPIPATVQAEYEKVYEYVDNLVDIEELEFQPYINPNLGVAKGRRFSFPFPDGMFKSVGELLSAQAAPSQSDKTAKPEATKSR